MARRNPIVSSRRAPEPPGIVELGEICARMRATGLDLFEALGRWVVDTDDPSLQQLFAEAGHRHAWHADLWQQRSPAIPPVEPDLLTHAFRTAIPDDDDRAGTYRRHLDRLLDRLDDLDDRTDPVLDPATHRVIRLVAADLRDLSARLAALEARR